MGTEQIQNSGNNMPLGKEYWKQQAEKEESGTTPWKSPTGSYNVPVGQENFELNGRKIQTSYMDYNDDGKVDEVIVI